MYSLDQEFQENLAQSILLTKLSAISPIHPARPEDLAEEFYEILINMDELHRLDFYLDVLKHPSLTDADLWEILMLVFPNGNTFGIGFQSINSLFENQQFRSLVLDFFRRTALTPKYFISLCAEKAERVSQNFKYQTYFALKLGELLAELNVAKES